MRKVLALVPLALAAAACGGTSTKAGSDECFKIWNGSANQRRQMIVAKLGTPTAVVSAISDTCGYIFHDKKRAFSLSAKRNGSSVGWDDLPMIGDWSAQQQKAAPDNAKVDLDGRISQR
jgi:hypothetical protein